MHDVWVLHEGPDVTVALLVYGCCTADCWCADTRAEPQGADTWRYGSGKVTGDRNSWHTIGCNNHTELRVGTSYERYTFTRCEEVCERGGGTLVRLAKDNTNCLGPELEALLGGGVAYIGLYETDEGDPCSSNV